jgi:hypothetical protein
MWNWVVMERKAKVVLEEECIPTVFKKCAEEQNAEEFTNICGRVCGCCYKEAPDLVSINTVAGKNNITYYKFCQMYLDISFNDIRFPQQFCIDCRKKFKSVIKFCLNMKIAFNDFLVIFKRINDIVDEELPDDVYVLNSEPDEGQTSFQESKDSQAIPNSQMPNQRLRWILMKVKSKPTQGKMLR